MTFAVPLAAILALILRPVVHISPRDGLLFVPAPVLAWALRFVWGYWSALLSFWATRADALLSLRESLVFLIGGHGARMMLIGSAALAVVLLLGSPVLLHLGLRRYASASS
jgi:ABC-type uncharacterized transport system permease subunit